MAEKVLIVHHKTITPGSNQYFNMLVEQVNRLLGVRAFSVEVDELDRLQLQPDVTISLFMFRGGHHATVLERFGRRVAGPIPPSIILHHVLRHYRLRGSRGLVDEINLVYYDSKRGRKEREDDVYRLRGMLLEHVASSIRVTAYNPPSKIKCGDKTLYVPLTIAPSILTRRLDEEGCHRLPSLLEGSLDLVLSWIAGILNCFQRC